MPTLTPTGPAIVENYNTAKFLEFPLVAFEKRKFMDVTIEDETVRLEFGPDDLYKGIHKGIRYRSEGPRWTVTP